MFLRKYVLLSLCLILIALNGLPVYAQMDGHCGNGLAWQLVVGETGTVSLDNASSLMLFALPGDTSETGELEPGDIVMIQAGPICIQDGQSWWLVSLEDDSSIYGWLSEGDSGGYWIQATTPAEPIQAGGGGGCSGGCGGGGGYNEPPPISLPPQQGLPPEPDDMFFQDYGVNPFLDTGDDHLSTFAVDVDTASYAIVRSYITDYGLLPPTESIRPEEFINAFAVDYGEPKPGDDFAIQLTAAPAPFGYDGHYLLRVGLRTQPIHPADRDPMLLIFVIDVSGSMEQGGRLEMVKDALKTMLPVLHAEDEIGIITFSDNSQIVLEPTSIIHTGEVLDAIDKLYPQNNTNAAAGIWLGYALAQQSVMPDRLTRVILLSDGVANTGSAVDAEPILTLIRSGIEQGISLHTIGVGMGNYNDILLEQLANNGDGNYFYVDTDMEARRLFGQALIDNLQTIAFDTRIQMDFNQEVTDRYRLIGYENRAIADEDFRDDTVDAGEVGAGHSVTALYEIALEEGVDAGTVATAQIRYQDADSEEIIEVSETISVSDLLDDINDAPADFWLHAAVAEFSELLRESYWAQDGNYVDLLMFASSLEDDLPGEQTTEFLDLIRSAGQIIDR